jgi:DNA replication protein DnaC
MKKEVDRNELQNLADRLGFKGLVANWSDFGNEPVIKRLLEVEEEDKNRRSLERRMRESQIKEMKPASDFDWSWPTAIDRQLVEELFTLKFMDEQVNPIFLAPNGLGKSMLSKNLIHAAVLAGHNTRFVSASLMLSDLSSKDGAAARKRCLLKYTKPDLLAIDELGYLSYDSRYADLLYEVINARYLQNSTIITTNKAFAEWGEIFPNAGCVVTLVDRLTHKSELVRISGRSYRSKEAAERANERIAKKTPKSKKKSEVTDAENTSPS